MIEIIITDGCITTGYHPDDDLDHLDEIRDQIKAEILFCEFLGPGDVLTLSWLGGKPVGAPLSGGGRRKSH